MLATESFAMAKRLLPGRGTGANAGRLYMMFLGGFGLYFPFVTGSLTAAYGEFDGFSAKEERTNHRRKSLM